MINTLRKDSRLHWAKVGEFNSMLLYVSHKPQENHLTTIMLNNAGCTIKTEPFLQTQ